MIVSTYHLYRDLQRQRQKVISASATRLHKKECKNSLVLPGDSNGKESACTRPRFNFELRRSLEKELVTHSAFCPENHDREAWQFMGSR